MKVLTLFSIFFLLLISCADNPSDKDLSNDYADEMIEVMELDVSASHQTAYDQAVKNGTELDDELAKVKKLLSKKKIIRVGDYIWAKNDDGSYFAYLSLLESNKIKITTFDLNGAKVVKKYLDSKKND
jgi:hypothetical protein